MWLSWLSSGSGITPRLEIASPVTASSFIGGLCHGRAIPEGMDRVAAVTQGEQLPLSGKSAVGSALADMNDLPVEIDMPPQEPAMTST